MYYKFGIISIFAQLIRLMEFLKKLKAFILTKYFLKQLGLVILAYILIVGITIFYLDTFTNHGQQIQVPNLIGRNVSSIQTELEE